MPEEKKDSFTFSDKIKSSKAAGNKSFAKSSAKIGRDGKPKATLFERTRRDAPFFIAALVALLLLPFLYKYSGQANEDQLVTPGMESAEFDPERYGFDTAMVEDPDGQIAQLAGRDSLSLIKGWGSNEEEDYARDDMDLDASASYEGDAEGEYSAERHSSSDMDVEENTTNIYKRRARAGTRAAFRRTKIGALTPAGLRRPGGSRLGINNWGGGLKGAAKKVGSGPTSAPKPVSLQPLRAAGPARSSFGQGAAAAARKGLDNMGKANAVEALRDSYVKPVGPTRNGGIDLFADGRTGGNGKLNHNINIGKGQTPWWWDMMKTRMQEEWMARFKRKWDWINFFDKLAQNILKGLLNCIITGDSDGDPDNFLGISAGGGTAPTCCGYKESDLRVQYGDELAKAGSLEAFCKGTMRQTLRDLKHDKSCGFKGGMQSAVALGPVASRLKCLGLNVGVYASGGLGLNGAGMACDNMPNYTVIPSGQARKWNIYTYVVARNYFPDSLKGKFKGLPTSGKNLLCASTDRKHGGSSLNHADITGGVGHVDNVRDFIIAQTKSTDNVPSEQQEIRERRLEVDQEALGDACVIVVSRGNILPYEAMKNKVMDLFKDLGGKDKVTELEAEEAFYQLDIMYVSSFAAKHKLAYAQWFESGHHLKELLPLPYWEFENAYVQHRGTTHKKDGSRDNVYKRKWRVLDQDMVRGPNCFYDNLNFECGPEDVAMAKLHFNAVSFKGGSGVRPSVDDVQVSASFRYLNDGTKGAKTPVEQPMIEPEKSADGFTFTYLFERIYDSNQVKNVSDKINPEGLVGNIEWRAKRGEQEIKKVCPLNLSGDGYTKYVREDECTSPQQSAMCCDKLMATVPHHWDASRPVGSQCVDDTPRPQVGKITRLAPVLSWVPFNGKVECRTEASDGVNPGEKVFGDCSKVPGITKDQDQHCGSQIPLMMDSEAAAQFVRDVVKTYNDRNPNAAKKLSDKFYANKYPTDGEFVDALFIAKELGITQVPSSAVCELARDFVRMSKDKHAGNMPVAGSNDDFKGLKRYYRNELGAFLAYVHPTSILYPARYYGKEMQVCDWRFLPEGSQCGGRKSTMKMGKAYYFNYYNDSKNHASLRAYLASFDDVGIPKTYPLAELVNGHTDLAHNCPTDNCSSTRNQYNKDNYFGLMISDVDSTDNQGQACVAFAGKAMMSVDKALEYVQTACRVGLDAKPYGNQFSDRPGPKAYVANQRFTRQGTSGGNDGSTQKQPQGKGRG